MSAEGRVTLARAGAVATLCIDRPAARNAMTWAMYEQLAAHCETISEQAATDPLATRVVVIRGAGGAAFVAGTDIAQFQAFANGDDGVAYERRIDEVIGLVERLPMPVVAAIDGWCVGGGLALATACDFRLATPAARFGVPIARTLGNTLSAPNLARLVGAWGRERVKRMLLLAEIFDAAQAEAAGFVLTVCGSGELEATITSLAGRLAALAPVTQRVAKESLRRLQQQSLPDDDDLVRACYGSADFRAGVDAFVEGRAPGWRGR